jgi:hypothetical protein
MYLTKFKKKCAFIATYQASEVLRSNMFRLFLPNFDKASFDFCTKVIVSPRFTFFSSHFPVAPKSNLDPKSRIELIEDRL